MLDEALALVEQASMRSCEAEIHRLRGELLLQSAGHLPESSKLSGRLAGTEAGAQAEACFHQAIEIARRQEAKSWELWTTMSLARLWQRQGRREEAPALLVDIYGRGRRG